MRLLWRRMLSVTSVRLLILLASPLCLFTACKPPEEVARTETGPFVGSEKLAAVGVFSLDVEEPSGLSLSTQGKSLWTVSDADGGVHEMTLEGRRIRRLATGFKDVEAVATLNDDQLAVVLERSREVVIIDQRGEELRRASLAIAGTDNSGLEGLAFDRKSKIYYVLKEKTPGLLLTLDENMKELSRRVLTFARDYSSIEFEPTRRQLWVMSDESRSVHVFDLEANLVASFGVDVQQAEGLAVDYAAKRLYVVSDKTEKLHVFSFPDF